MWRVFQNQTKRALAFTSPVMVGRPEKLLSPPDHFGEMMSGKRLLPPRETVKPPMSWVYSIRCVSVLIEAMAVVMPPALETSITPSCEPSALVVSGSL